MTLSDPTILVVEDNPTDVMLIRRAFDKANWRTLFTLWATETRLSRTCPGRRATPIVRCFRCRS